MGPRIRAAALRGFTPLVDSLGGDGAALLGRFGLTGEALLDDNALVPAATVGRVLETAAATLDCPDFGLRLAQRQDTSILGPLAVAIENSPTIGDALDCASRFLFMHSPVLSVSRPADPEGQSGVVGVLYGTTEPGARLSPQVVDVGLGVVHRIILLLNGGRYGLRSAHLSHPPLAPISCYTEFFGADVRFDRAAALLRVPAALISTPLRDRDNILGAVAIDYLDSHFTDPRRTVTAQVHDALARSLGTTPMRISPIARLLRKHPRTLQRHLAAEGTTFEGVLDDVRREAAHRLLTRTDLPLSQVAAMVGFAEQSALTRAARRWFGDSPTHIRRNGTRSPAARGHDV
jgi:AraC-like DNA-binding protein